MYILGFGNYRPSNILKSKTISFPMQQSPLGVEAMVCQPEIMTLIHNHCKERHHFHHIYQGI